MINKIKKTNSKTIPVNTKLLDEIDGIRSKLIDEHLLEISRLQFINFLIENALKNFDKNIKKEVITKFFDEKKFLKSASKRLEKNSELTLNDLLLKRPQKKPRKVKTKTGVKANTGQGITSIKQPTLNKNK